jgi:hypothetical protein
MSFEKSDFRSSLESRSVWYASRNTCMAKGDLESVALTHSDRPQGFREMNIQNLKKYVYSLALVIGFVIAPGLSSLSTVQAQGWRGRSDDRRDDRWDDRRRDRDDRWDNRWERREEYRGFRDGFELGRIDARRRHRPDFNDYRQYRHGSRDYREGFRRGYFQAYRQFTFFWRW